MHRVDGKVVLKWKAEEGSLPVEPRRVTGRLGWRIPVTERDIWGSLGECNSFSSDFESAVTETHGLDSCPQLQTAKMEQKVSRETWRTSRPSETCLRDVTPP